MPRHAYFILFLALLCLREVSAKAGDTLVIHHVRETDSLAVLDFAAYYMDQTNHLQWKDICRKKFNYEMPSPWKNENFQRKKVTLWLSCTIQNASADSLHLLLVFHRFSYFTEGIITGRLDTLIYRPNYWFTPHSKIKRKNIPVSLAKDEQKTFWLRISDPGSNLFVNNFYLTNIAAYENSYQASYQEDFGYYVFKIVFLAIVAFIMLHSLVQYSIRLRREFLYYAAYSFCAFLFFLRQLEMSLHYDILFSFFPYIYKYCNNPLSILLYYAYFRFARQFVDFRSLASWFHKIIIWTERLLMIMFFTDLFCGIFGHYDLQHALFAILRILLLLISFIGIFVLLRSRKIALYFFGAGSLLLIIGSLLSMIFSFYPQKSPFFSDDPLRYMQIGIIVELFCFTSGLSYKSHLIEVEKQYTQMQLIQQLEENRRLQDELNTRLEMRVKEQTEQLLKQQNELEKDKERQLTLEFKKKLTEMELQVLKAQLNPHFYFNTLNNLYGLTIIDPKKAPDAILRLSDIMEYVIYDCKNEKVLLAKELKFISSYIELERLRYEDNASIYFHIHGNCDEKLISPLLLIQFVENAFKHGMEQSEGDCFMKVSIDVQNNHLRYSSVNSFKETSPGGRGLGLSNVKKRLSMLYPNRHQLLIDPSGSEFRIELYLDLS